MDDDRHGDVESSLNQTNGVVAVDYDLLVEVEWSQPIEHYPSLTETNQS